MYMYNVSLESRTCISYIGVLHCIMYMYTYAYLVPLMYCVFIRSQVLDFHGPFTLPPTAEWHRPFALQFQATSSDCLFNTTLRLSTNASLFNIPLYCYDGRVKVSVHVHVYACMHVYTVCKIGGRQVAQAI